MASQKTDQKLRWSDGLHGVTQVLIILIVTRYSYGIGSFFFTTMYASHENTVHAGQSAALAANRCQLMLLEANQNNTHRVSQEAPTSTPGIGPKVCLQSP